MMNLRFHLVPYDGVPESTVRRLALILAPVLPQLSHGTSVMLILPFVFFVPALNNLSYLIFLQALISLYAVKVIIIVIPHEEHFICSLLGAPLTIGSTL